MAQLQHEAQHAVTDAVTDSRLVARSRYAYANDMQALRSLWPVLVGHMNLHLHMLSEGSDGKLHLPPSWSPEYNEKVNYMGAGDTTYHLGLVRWGLERLVEGCAILSVRSPSFVRTVSLAFVSVYWFIVTRRLRLLHNGSVPMQATKRGRQRWLN
jgi:hypothetical protein